MERLIGESNANRTPLNHLEIQVLVVLSLDCAFELAMNGIILEQANHVAEVNEGVTDGDNIHFARVKSSSGDHTPNTAKSIYHNLHHHVSELQLALQWEDVAVWGTEGAESHSVYDIYVIDSLLSSIYFYPFDF